jgi:putative phosphoribosyl transferase
MMFFEDRLQAGEELAKKVKELEPLLKDPIVLGIPRGGVPVGDRVAEAICAPLDTIVLRKLPIPASPEAGFGVVTLDKTTIFNQEMLSYIHLSDRTIQRIVDEVYAEVLRRNRIYRRGRPFPSLEDRSVIITDDGLATGFTMLGAVRFSKKRGAGETIVAVPVAHQGAYNLVSAESDRTVALYVSRQPYFAVASFYGRFPDMSDEEVVRYLHKKRTCRKT